MLLLVVLASAYPSLPAYSKGKLRKRSHVVLNSPITQYHARNIPEAPELGTPHYKVVPNGVRFRVVQLYHRKVSVVALYKPGGIVRGILASLWNG